MLVAVFLAFAFPQTAFIGHDAVHQPISGSKRINDLLGRLHGNLLVGLSTAGGSPNTIGATPIPTRSAAIPTSPTARSFTPTSTPAPAPASARSFFSVLHLEALDLHAAALTSRPRPN
jgi:hypothetical protein